VRTSTTRCSLASPRDGLAQLAAEAADGDLLRWDLVAEELERTLSSYVDDEGLLVPVPVGAGPAGAGR
jgi:hypothetical protein